MTIRLHSAVGSGAPNEADDVRSVQTVLREHVPEAAGGPEPGFEINGVCDGTDADRTVLAIKKFQWRQLRMPGGGANRLPDGRINTSGFTLRRLNLFDPGPGPAPPFPAGQPGGDHRPLLFTEMWHLIERNRGFTATYRATPESAAVMVNAGSIAPTQLWIAIFWEESNFRNKRGRPARSGAVPLGFGQVMTSNLSRLNAVYGTNFSEGSILGDPDESVRVAMLALGEHFRTNHTLDAALRGYANEQDEIVGKWMTCSAALQQLGLHPGASLRISDELGVRVRECLWAARNGRRGCTPDLAFE